MATQRAHQDESSLPCLVGAGHDPGGGGVLAASASNRGAVAWPDPRDAAADSGAVRGASHGSTRRPHRPGGGALSARGGVPGQARDGQALARLGPGRARCGASSRPCRRERGGGSDRLGIAEDPEDASASAGVAVRGRSRGAGGGRGVRGRCGLPGHGAGTRTFRDETASEQDFEQRCRRGNGNGALSALEVKGAGRRCALRRSCSRLPVGRVVNKGGRVGRKSLPPAAERRRFADGRMTAPVAVGSISRRGVRGRARRPRVRYRAGACPGCRWRSLAASPRHRSSFSKLRR